MLNEEPFIEFVMKQAEKNGKIFIIDSGEGNDYIDTDTGWYVEDLSGWYINTNDKNTLLKAIENGTAYNDFSDSYVFPNGQNQTKEILRSYSENIESAIKPSIYWVLCINY